MKEERLKQNDDSENYIGLERLVKKAKAGDQQAKEKLIFAFRPLILTTIIASSTYGDTCHKSDLL